jgi:hypothetical protein
MNDRISDRISAIDFRELMSQRTEIEQLLSILDMAQAKSRLELELDISNDIALFAVVLSLLPVIFLLTGLTALLDFNVIIYLLCAILIVTGYLVNRLANRANRHLQTNLIR